MSDIELTLISSLFNDLFPVHRSIAGPGLRKSLNILSDKFDLDIVEYPSRLDCFGWVTPDEWNPRQAWIKDSKGNYIVNYEHSNLHLVSHSIPIDLQIDGLSLRNYLHFSSLHPDLIPYVTAYYSPTWGFCLTQDQYSNIQDNEEYHVYIDASSYPGSMTGLVSKLESTNQRNTKSYLISSYLCHPSLANDNLSGPILACLLWQRLRTIPNLKNNWYLQISPETIGALAWLKSNEQISKDLKGAFVCTTCAGPGRLGYKDSFDTSSTISEAAHLAFRDLDIDPKYYPFVPDGSDERQFSSPAYRIPCITITKDKYYEYEYYHTSGDNLNYVSAEALLESLEVYWRIVLMLEDNTKFLRKSLSGETRLGPHGLYPQVSGHVNQNTIDQQLSALAWVDWSGDGTKDLISLAKLSGLPFDQLKIACDKLIKAGIGESNAN